MMFSQTSKMQENHLRRCKIRLNLSTFTLERFVNSILREQFIMKNPSIRCESYFLFESGEGLESTEINVYKENSNLTLMNLGLTNGRIMACNDFDSDIRLQIEIIDSNEDTYQIIEERRLNSLDVNSYFDTANGLLTHRSTFKRKKVASPERHVKMKKLF